MIIDLNVLIHWNIQLFAYSDNSFHKCEAKRVYIK